MKWNEFEDQLKKEVNTSTSTIDTEALWKKINQKQKKKVFPFYWLFLLALIAGGIAISGLFITSSLKINNISNKQINLPNNQNITYNNLTNTEKETRKLTAAKSPVKITAYTKRSALDIQIDNNNSNILPNAKTTIITKSKKIKKYISNVEISNSTTPSTKSISNLISESNPTKLNNETNTLSLIKSTLPETESRTNEEKESSTGPFLNSVNNEFEIAPIILPNLAISLLDYEKANETFKFNYYPNNQSISKAKKAIKYTNYSVYLGTGIWTAKMESPDTSFESYPTQRKNTEAFVEYIDAGISFEKSLNHFNNTAFITGLKFQKFTSRFSYTKNWEVTDTIVKKAASFNFYSSGYVDTSYNESSVTFKYSRNITHYNSISCISVPIYFRIMEIGINHKLSLLPIVGVNIGFWQNAEGFILDNTGEFIKINEKDKIYNIGFSFSWEAQLQANYELNKNHFLYLQSFYLSDISSRTTSQYPLVQKNSCIGVRLGYGFRF